MTNSELNKLDKEDIYSLILFTLYKLKNTREFSTLSELTYILDEDSLFNLLECFGGMTIRVPTLDEFRLMVKAIVLYERVNIEGMPLTRELKSLSQKGVYKISDLKSAYEIVCEVLKDYDFTRTK